MKLGIGRWGLLALMASSLAGCLGDGGGGTSTTTSTSSGGTTTSVALPANPPGTTVVNASTLTAEQFAATQFSGTVTGVTINSPPTVTFQVRDAAGNRIAGLGYTSKGATSTVAGLTNMSFTIAKLVPGTNGSASRWVSYIVTTKPWTSNATSATTNDQPTRPTTDNTGTLVDNGDGTYKYTFHRDITGGAGSVQDVINKATYTGNNVKADLDDLTYQPNLTHRVGVHISGSAPGTGTNTADAVLVKPAVGLSNPTNLFFDFVPATGAIVSQDETDGAKQRNVVNVSNCLSCHTKFTFHGGNILTGVGGSRQDTKMCVLCHTDQRKYGQAEATTTATGYSGSQNKIGGKAVKDLPAFVHKIHMGERLIKTGYNSSNVLFNEIRYPQPIENCVKCHSNAPQANNWKTVPTRTACGSCHDGINFATGTGTTLAGATTGHIGGAKSDDSQCVLCHSATDIEKVYHVTVDAEGSSGRAGYPANTAQDVPTVGYASGQGPTIPLASQLGNLPAGVYKIDMDIKQVTVANGKATVKYRIKKDGTPVTLNATGYLMDNVDGTPSIYVAYAVPQDGIASPADWNGSINAAVKDIRDGKSGNSQTGPDSDGYYTATLGGTIPTGAKMVTAALGVNYQGFVQLNHSAFPKGIRLREPAFAMKVADGYTARRQIVSKDKCNSCHGQLGVHPSFHGGARNNGEGCAICHQANTSTGHTGAANHFGGGWSVSEKNLVHGIHGAAKREQAYSYGATEENEAGFDVVTYPSPLRNCEACHVPGSYDFSNSTNASAIPNLLWTTEASKDMTNPTGAHAIGQAPWVKSLGRGEVNYTTDNLVSSPIASACFGCHDNSAAISHMQQNGGSIYATVSTISTGGARPAPGTTTGFAFTKAEQCTVCHASGKIADIRAAHMGK